MTALLPLALAAVLPYLRAGKTPWPAAYCLARVLVGPFWRGGAIQPSATDMIRVDNNRRKEDPSARACAIREALGQRSIVMVGLMGCGKTSIGRRLSMALDLPFVDADDESEQAAGKTISEIFADHGEAYFRDGERKVIARLLRHGPQVLATGGGAFMNVETRSNISQAGISVWLKADLSLLMKRVLRRDNRPLLKTVDPEAKMRELMDQRYPIYAEADVIVESRDIAHDVIVEEILDLLAERSFAVGPDR
jgi:shikimate kinase